MKSRALGFTLVAGLLGICDIAWGDVISVGPRDSAGLIAAIKYANERDGDHMIELAANSLYTLGGSINGQPGPGLPVVAGRIRILGNGSEIRRYCDDPLLLMSVAPLGSLRLEHLTLAEGTAGALINHGEVELHNVRFVDNAVASPGSVIVNYGQMNVADSELAFNQVVHSESKGGIVLNYGSLRMQNSHFVSNWWMSSDESSAAPPAVLNFGELAMDGLGDAREGAPAVASVSRNGLEF